MKWYGLALGAPVAAAVLVAVIGAFLPVQHQAARRIVLKRSAAEVFDALTDVAAYPTWRKELKTVERLADRDGRTCWRETSGSGQLDLCVESCEPAARLVTRIVTPDSPFGGTWTFRLAARAGETELTITENGEVYNPLFRALARFVFGHTATMDAYLRSLAVHFGESTTIDDGEPDAPPSQSSEVATER